MTEQITDQLSLGDVEAVVTDVWTAFFGETDPLIYTGTPTAAHAAWTASVTVTGEWNGAIGLELTHPGADAVTRGLLAFNDSVPIAPADVADAVGELVNMVGGNIKSLLPGPSALSIPIVTTGQITALSNQTEVCRFDAIWAGHPVTVRVQLG